MTTTTVDRPLPRRYSREEDNEGLNQNMIMEHWNQAESIAYECAREAIGERMSIITEQIADEKARTQPDLANINRLRTERAKFAEKRANLHVGDHAEINRVRTEDGAYIRAWRFKHQAIAA
ncbi:MAG: hypothetical protein LBU53_01890 [Zoogloeaceae bacterium]|jgi:hypothetical protein|nr:hypothetical protein [Zoogloeaceae bacterium]